MDYKEKYEMALEGIQEILSSGADSIKMSRLKLRLQGIFPELKESEDEKIRKELLKAFQESEDSLYMVLSPQRRKSFIAWLEKQSNKNEIDYNEELKKCKANPLYFFDKYVKVKLKEQKPPLSEEVEKAIQLLKDIADEEEEDYCPHNANNLRKAAQYLETCRPQNQWKPSDEQMGSLANACDGKILNLDYLNSLYQDLKKLKGG